MKAEMESMFVFYLLGKKVRQFLLLKKRKTLITDENLSVENVFLIQYWLYIMAAGLCLVKCTTADTVRVWVNV